MFKQIKEDREIEISKQLKRKERKDKEEKRLQEYRLMKSEQTKRKRCSFSSSEEIENESSKK